MITKYWNKIKSVLGVHTSDEVTPKELKALLYNESVGDGRAEFLPDMTEEEYQEYMRDEVHGWEKFWGRKK